MTTTNETAYAVGLLVSRFIVGMSGASGERLQQIATEAGPQSKIAFLRSLQAWCRETESAIEGLIETIETVGANDNI